MAEVTPAQLRPRRSGCTILCTWPRSAVAALCSGIALSATCLWRPPQLLVWNASQSSPVGLYAITGNHLRAGDMVVAWPPESARRLAAQRRYLPSTVPLVKHVEALGGERVCATGEAILIDGRRRAVRRRRDPSGRPLQWWSGCRVLRPRELFLLSPNMPDAFDGRYFGVTEPSEVIGKATLLWAR